MSKLPASPYGPVASELVLHVVAGTVIRRCDEHGYTVGDTCPTCDARGTLVLDGDRRVRLSKFLSGALRHFPDDAGLAMDDAGWVPFESVVSTVLNRYPWAEREHVEAVVATDAKGRFERRDGAIRAAYGHSVEVELEPTEATVPNRLYHGTAPRNIPAILEDGLRPMRRQSVHLSSSPEEARSVGRRHARHPEILHIDARSLLAAGFEIDRRGTKTYTVDRVPPAHLERVTADDDE